MQKQTVQGGKSKWEETIHMVVSCLFGFFPLLSCYINLRAAPACEAAVVAAARDKQLTS